MHNAESVPEYEMHKIILDFEIQTAHLISARRPDLVIVNKEILSNSGLFYAGWQLNNAEGKRKER